MNTIKEQFYKTTEQYFQASHTLGHEMSFQSEIKIYEPEIKKFYIKEGPFINYKDKQ